ncbi:MAG: thiamine-phosphate kinase, partial [Hyphomicrobiales bacterium]|nr:thiamine-phosphate kinase [Hyphomicrobiales bacterium]
ALPEGVADAWLSEFARGLKEDAETFACPLLGGDTVRTSGPIVVSVAAIGMLPAGRMVGRAGARAGDHVLVTGTIGDAMLGLQVQQRRTRAIRWGLSEPMCESLIARYRLPQPRNALAEAVRACANASMDVSDGLAGDLAKLCRASGVGASIEVERVPLSSAGRAALAAEPSLREDMLTGGDDYEILCSVPEDRLDRFSKMASAARVEVSAIGRIAEQAAGVRFLDQDGAPLVFARPSFSHF